MSKIEKNRSERRVHGGRPRPTGAVVPRGKEKPDQAFSTQNLSFVALELFII
jgi:hypothetical protein